MEDDTALGCAVLSRVIVTYPLKPETRAEMEARWKRGEPMATFSFTVVMISKPM